MNAPPPDLLSLITVAAEMRAGGASWEARGVKSQRTAGSCRRWTDRYPEVWRQLYWAEKTRLVELAGDEALACLRQMLRDKDNKLRQNTAKFLYSQTCEVLEVLLG